MTSPCRFLGKCRPEAFYTATHPFIVPQIRIGGPGAEPPANRTALRFETILFRIRQNRFGKNASLRHREFFVNSFRMIQTDHARPVLSC